ncbi:hypothetical protein [Sorangium sp. So ce1153]|uniref:hypothetical protein n=1 Tax=Sorangium sp. So ce1153 TaxID=3133333 RepID=UPI003F62616E
MTAGERPTTAEPEERSLSAEEADRIAASIRPSWEGFDELANPRGEARGSAPGPETGAPAAKQAEIPAVPIVGVSGARHEPAVASFAAAPAATAAAPGATGAAPRAPAAGVLQAPPAGASGVSDTVIDGVPTIAVGDEPKGAPAAEAASRDAGAAAGGEQPSQASALPLTDTDAAGGAASASAPEGGPGKRGKYPAPAGKTRVGMGAPDDMPGAHAAEPDAPTDVRAAEPQARPAPAPLPDDEPRSARAARTRSRAAHPAAGKADAAAATAARTEDHDPIEIPVSSPNKTALRLGIAIVGAAFLFFVGRALIGPGRDDAGPEPGPTSASPAAEAPPTVPAATPVATAQPTASASPAASVTEGGATTAPPPSASAPASPPAPAATPPSAAAAASSAARTTPAAPPPEPKATPPAKKPAPAAPTQPGTSSTGGNKGGGIIRDAPF